MGRLENYLHKPWSPPEVHLYPAVGEFLANWTRMHGPRMEIVRVLGEDPSPRAREIRDLLERNGIPHGFYRADAEDSLRLIEKTRLDPTRLPAVVLLDGDVLSDPTNAEIMDAKGFIVTGTDVNTESADWPLDPPPTRFETSMPGVFAAGDVRSGSAKRVGSAVGEGAVAMPFIREYLKARCPWGQASRSARAASRRSHEDRRPGRSHDRATDSV